MRRGVLFVSPSAEDARALTEMLKPISVPLVCAASVSQAKARLEHEVFGTILTESCLPDGTWRDVLSLSRAGNPRCSVLVTDPRADAALWVDVLESGAYDLLCQPLCSAEVQRIVTNALAAPPEHWNSARAAV